MPDSPDWEVTTSAVSVTATKITWGLDAAKSASPTVGDVYLAIDTLVLYVCATAGSWTGFDAAILVQGILAVARIPDLAASKITSGRFGMARMPAGTLNYVLTAQGAGADPAYAAVGLSQAQGSYSGNDTEYRAIAHGLGQTPKLVLICASSGTVFLFRILSSQTVIFCSSAQTYGAGFAMDATSFYVGKTGVFALTANNSGYTYYWLALA